MVKQRRRLSLSQSDVARRVRNAAKAEGRQSGATKQWVSEIERTGRIPHPDGLRWLAVAIEVPIERLVATLISRSVLVRCLAMASQLRNECCTAQHGYCPSL